MAGLCLLSSLFFAKHLELASNVSVTAPQLVLSHTAAAAVEVPTGDAVVHNSVLPQTLVTAQSTLTPSPTAAPADANDPMNVMSAAPTPVATPPVVYIIYTVQEGDTIGGIAAKYGISSSSIVWNNLDLEDPDTLGVGQFLRVPMSDGIIYDVRLGDTLSDISSTFGVSVDDIIGFEGNHLSNADGITENQTIFIPGGAMPVATPAPTPDATDDPYSPAPAPAPHGGGGASSSGFIWPVSGPISSYFGPSHPLGIDIDQYNSPGAPIYAAASGIVTFAGGDACCSYGYYVVINHQNGFETLYAHLASFAVSQGQWVDQGDVIGYVGLTGRTTGYHLHFEVHLNGAVVDPLDYLPPDPYSY